jgi:hypothetical protein
VKAWCSGRSGRTVLGDELLFAGSSSTVVRGWEELWEFPSFLLWGGRARC